MVGGCGSRDLAPNIHATEFYIHLGGTDYIVSAQLLFSDGSRQTADEVLQVTKLTAHLFISVGFNDLLACAE